MGSTANGELNSITALSANVRKLEQEGVSKNDNI